MDLEFWVVSHIQIFPSSLGSSSLAFSTQKFSEDPSHKLPTFPSLDHVCSPISALPFVVYLPYSFTRDLCTHSVLFAEPTPTSRPNLQHCCGEEALISRGGGSG